MLLSLDCGVLQWTERRLLEPQVKSLDERLGSFTALPGFEIVTQEACVVGLLPPRYECRPHCGVRVVPICGLFSCMVAPLLIVS